MFTNEKMEFVGMADNGLAVYREIESEILEQDCAVINDADPRFIAPEVE